MGRATKAANLAWDLLVFTEILAYWTLVVLVMLPARWVDRRAGTKLFPALDRAARAIAGG